MLVTHKYDPSEKPDAETLERIRAAAERPITYDPDCPPLSAEEIAFLRQIIPVQRAIGRRLTHDEIRVLQDAWKNKSWAHYVPESSGVCEVTAEAVI
jgi:hypothetical protein